MAFQVDRYERVPAVTTHRRPYRLTLRLPRRADALHLIAAEQSAARALVSWADRRRASGQPYLTGTISQGVVVDAWPPPHEGSATDVVADPGLIVTGEVSVTTHAGVSDEVAEELVDVLGCLLGIAVMAPMVTASYCDRVWVLAPHTVGVPPVVDLDEPAAT